MNEFLFSYGTLQLEKVQLASFGRLLSGTKEVLEGFKLEQIQITEEAVLEKSEQKFHPIAIPSNNNKDKISGILYTISSQELKQADQYEVSDYQRVRATFCSGKEGWIYIKFIPS
ncbi:MAG: gamma-glutamylcyclotransferase (GGCT)/AIG2-like uncharacterized protein YtfP [Chitinophagales bacterium]|jgi:gamma-glutamylcyclotransferase (GGCT)/AIG2-like uncharacterized protein YtfP